MYRSFYTFAFTFTVTFMFILDPSPKSKVIDSSHYSYLNLLRIVKLKANNKLVVENIFLERQLNERLECLGSAVPLTTFTFTSPAAHILMVYLLCKNGSTFHFPITIHKCLYIKVNHHDIISILTLFLFLF